MTNPLETRRNKLEEEFFQNQDKEKIEKMRANASREELIEELRVASGMEDPKVLAALADQGLTPATIVALRLVPLVQIAWADGVIQDAERDTIVLAARAKGIKKDSLAFELLEKWLRVQPSQDLFDAWTRYVKVLAETFPKSNLTHFKAKIIQLSEEIAASAGGILGFRAVAKSEKSVLDEIKAAFD